MLPVVKKINQNFNHVQTTLKINHVELKPLFREHFLFNAFIFHSIPLPLAGVNYNTIWALNNTCFTLGKQMLLDNNPIINSEMHSKMHSKMYLIVSSIKGMVNI